MRDQEPVLSTFLKVRHMPGVSVALNRAQLFLVVPLRLGWAPSGTGLPIFHLSIRKGSCGQGINLYEMTSLSLEQGVLMTGQRCASVPLCIFTTNPEDPSQWVILFSYTSLQQLQWCSKQWATSQGSRVSKNNITSHRELYWNYTKQNKVQMKTLQPSKRMQQKAAVNVYSYSKGGIKTDVSAHWEGTQHGLGVEGRLWGWFSSSNKNDVNSACKCVSVTVLMLTATSCAVRAALHPSQKHPAMNSLTLMTPRVQSDLLFFRSWCHQSLWCFIYKGTISSRILL